MIARIVDEKTQETQLLKDHLFSTASLCRDFLAGCGFGETGYLLGLLHDVGKYSEDFQNYIQSIAGLLKSGDPGFIPKAEKQRGKIPHAAAGAWFWKQCLEKDPGPLMEILMEMPVIDHHAFLEDVIQPDGESFFLNRSPEKFKGLDRIFERMEPEVRDEIRAVIGAGKYEEELLKNSTGKISFKLGMRLRLLYSALIDADRTDPRADRSAVIFPAGECWRNVWNGIWRNSAGIRNLAGFVQIFPLRHCSRRHCRRAFTVSRFRPAAAKLLPDCGSLCIMRNSII